MAIFNYLTKDSEGKRKEGEIRADSLDNAIQKLSANGQMVISLKETDDTFDFLGPFIDEIQLSIEKAKNRIPLSNIVFFTRQLATMFSAGLTLERAIQSLGAEEKHRKFKRILNTVSDNIRKGLNLSESLSRHPGVFNTLFVAMVKAGEVSGNLNEILEQLSSYLENLDDTRRKVKSAMNYPIFMILFFIIPVLNLKILINRIKNIELKEFSIIVIFCLINIYLFNYPAFDSGLGGGLGGGGTGDGDVCGIG